MLLAVVCVALVYVGGYQVKGHGDQVASSSSFFSKFVAANAVDGNTDGNWRSKSCFITNLRDESPWWMVDLGDVQTVTGVTIYNRADCCGEKLSNFKVSVWREDPKTGAGAGMEMCSTYPGVAPTGAVLDLKCGNPIDGRFVRIEKAAKTNILDVLAFCEVQVQKQETPVSACPDGYVKIEGECLVFAQTYASYAEAIVYCGKMESGLLMITSEALDVAVKQHMTEAELTGRYYVGANAIQDPKVYRWRNEDEVEATWKPKLTQAQMFPENSANVCGYINADADGAWESSPCSAVNYFICQKL